MKIVCEACQAKYSIADEKVRGKVFKIRCKKCSHVIVVRGTGEVSSATSGEFASSPSSAPDLALDAGWHIVVDGEQVGPLSEGDIRARLARGEITPDTYIWKEGLADWVKVGTLAEFKGGESEASNPFATGDAGGPFADVATTVSPGAMGGVADMLGASAPAAAQREAPVPDLFASPAAEAGQGGGQGGYGGAGYGAGYGGGDLPAASEQYAASARGGGGNGSSAGGAGLTGQRHENSVLFSLSNLEALAKPNASSLPVSARGGSGGGGAGGVVGGGPGSSTTTEGSGLIDIRAMANMTLGASAAARNEQRNNELPAFSAPQFSPVAPVLLSPGAGGGTPRWAIGLAVVLGGLLVALTIVGFSLLTRDDRPPELAQPVAPLPPGPPVAAAPAAPVEKAAAPPATPPPAANEELPPREPGKPGLAAADKPDRAPGARGPARGAGSRRGTSSRGGSVSEITDRSPTITPPSRPAEAAPRKPKDDIEALLEAASGGGRKASGGGSPAAARREEEAPSGGGSERAAPLGREDIVKGMNGVMPKGRECFAQYKVPGIANVKVTVAPSGRVTNGVVVGKFAGTPSGSCVESALKSAKFPPSAGLTFDYFIPLK